MERGFARAQTRSRLPCARGLLAKRAGQEGSVVIHICERAALAAKFRQLLSAARDAVRVMDDLADYLGFSVVRPRADGQAGSPKVPAEDPQLNAIRERSRIVFERLQRAVESVGKTAPEAAH